MLTLRQAFNQFVKSPEHATRTIETYEDALTHWERTEVTVVAAGSQLQLRIPVKDPPFKSIDAQTLIDFKNVLLAKLSPNTVRKNLIHLRTILYRLGPRSRFNPLGLGLMPEALYVPLPSKVKRRARCADESELARLYRSCDVATWPRCEIAPAEWWRSLIVVLYNVALRRLDYLAVEWDHVDLRRGILEVTAHKTGKPSELPLHPVAVEHLLRIRTDRILVWPWRPQQAAPDPIDKKKTSLYRQWHRICAAAGLLKRLVPHDLRKTSGSQLYETSPGAASELLQHASITTTQESYANISRHTRDLMLSRPQPTAFSAPEIPEGPEPAILRFPGRAG